ncbi:MAG TPA: hypothetical protein DD827_11555 [Gammaproteobacteria bacterium]|jgi:hypothetical protein|nr:hypothetical protein [Gammaproteobacteria bacterium]
MPTEQQIKDHNHTRRMRRKHEQKFDPKIDTCKRIFVHPDLYEDHIVRIHANINIALEYWFEIPLFGAEENKAAQLIYNDLEGPLIHLEKGRYGTKETKESISDLRPVSRLFKETDNLHMRQRAIECLRTLPYPINLRFMETAIKAEPADTLSTFTSGFADYLQDQLGFQSRGNARAYRTALAVKAAYEYYCREAISIGTDYDGTVVGRYCRCLEEIYEIVGLAPKTMGYAERAYSCSESDPLLANYREFFKRNLVPLGHHPMVFTKFGWVENMTFREKLFNLFATKCNKLEFLQWYNVCLNGRVYTMTPIKSSILSRLGQNVLNGATEGLARLF